MATARPKLGDVIPHDVFVDIQTSHDGQWGTLFDALDAVQEANINDPASLVDEFGNRVI